MDHWSSYEGSQHHYTIHMMNQPFLLSLISQLILCVMPHPTTSVLLQFQPLTFQYPLDVVSSTVTSKWKHDWEDAMNDWFHERPHTQPASSLNHATELLSPILHHF